MKTYTLSQDYKARALRRTQIAAGVFNILMLGVFVVVVVSSAQIYGYGDFSLGRITTAVITLLIMLGAMGFGVMRAYRRQRKRLEAPRIEFDNDMIARPQGVLPRVEIRRDEVVSIEEMQTGLCIVAEQPRRVVLVPIGLDSEDYQAIKTSLAEWAPIKAQKPRSRWLNYLPGIALLVGFGILFFSWSVWVVIPVAIAIVGFFSYIMWQIRRALRTKAGFLIAMQFGLGLLIIILIMAVKIVLVISLANSTP